MHLKRLAYEACANGSCPVIYETPTGEIVVQGLTTTLSPAYTLGPTEMAVEIPRELLFIAVEALRGK